MRMNAGVDVEDDEKGKLFVGGLSWETTQDSLQRYFSRYGEVIDCVVMKNNETGRSRGFGFVTFADPNNVQVCMDVVLQSGPHNLDGRTIDPKQCNPRTMQKPKTRGGSYPKVFLGGLPSNVTETDLRMFFGRYGKVMEVVIMYDQEKKKSRGFGFLSFEDEASVERVTTEHYITLNGKQVEIKKAEPRDGSQNHKMNQDPINQSMNSNWGPPPSAQIGNPMTMQGPNSQMNAGPPMNMMAPNMMGGYPSTAGWGSQQQNYGYGGPSPANAYNQGWGPSPPQAAPQAPPPHQWSNYNAQQTPQGYNSAFDMYNSSNAAQTAAPGSGISGGNWNSWGPLTNSGASAGSNEMYNRQSGSGSAPTGMGPTGNAGNNTGKGPSADYSYGSYGNYTNDQPQSYGGPPARSTYGNDIGQYPPTGDDYKRYLNQNIKQII